VLRRDFFLAAEVVRYTKSGISEKMMNKMKRGHIDNVSELDLHGYTIKQTCEALSEFIYRDSQYL
jgi:DNA-nicking Smr family endonuclease